MRNQFVVIDGQIGSACRSHSEAGPNLAVPVHDSEHSGRDDLCAGIGALCRYLFRQKEPDSQQSPQQTAEGGKRKGDNKLISTHEKTP